MISSSRLKAQLWQQIGPVGKGSKIGALLKGGGFAQVFRALEGGSITVQWFELPPGAHLAAAQTQRHKPRKSVLVASGHVTFANAGTAAVHLKPTATGRRLLEHARRLRLTADGVFTPDRDGAIVVQSRTFTVAR